MLTPGTMIRRERERLGLSTRHLAVLANVSYPTISRIENDHDEPRWTTMQRIAAALGKTCTFDDGPSFIRLADLVDPTRTTADTEPDWTRLRNFADQLALHPELTAAATADPPTPSGSPLTDNILAAVAERSAANVGIRPAAWTKTIEPLHTLWQAPGTPHRRARLAAQTPPEFIARNIELPESAIWRDRTLSTT